MCVAYSHRISADSDYDDIATHLIKNHQARAVILFTYESHARRLFKELDKFRIYNYFIFINSDSSSEEDYGAVANGYFGVSFEYGSLYTRFAEYYKHLKPYNSSGNPWLRTLWENDYNCKWNPTSDAHINCQEFENESNPAPFNIWANKYFDGVRTYALALDNMLKEQCPEVFTDLSKLDECLIGSTLLSYMKNLTFDGISGHITFNEDGDMLGKYTLNQYLYINNKHIHNMVAVWEKETESISLYPDRVTWDVYKEKIDSNETVIGMAKSVCSKPCKKKQFPVKQEVHCCWICRECRSNEIIVNQTSCGACPVTFWPDDESATTCISIEPTYLKSTDIIAIGLIFLACLSLIMTIILIILFYKNRGEKLIRASGRELMTIIMGGITLAYLIVFTFITKPTTVFCYISHFGFNISVSLIYGPLLMKTNRVYRIFSGGKKGVKTFRFISSSSQLFMTIIIILMQVSLPIL